MKKDGSAIITVPYGRDKRPEHRMYDSGTLGRLVNGFSVARQEFYRYDTGKWVKCN